jgi:hypothetical protein
MDATRWHQDSDQWVWRVYENHAIQKATTNIYIIRQKDGWRIIDAEVLCETDKHNWVGRVTKGEGVCIAGPFAELDHAKGAWRVMFG